MLHARQGAFTMVGQQRLWIGTSWKMNKTLPEARHFAEGLLRASAHEGIQRFVIPPFTVLREVKALLAETDVMVGAQNMHWAEAGPWTGEISPVMLQECGADLVELGHCERRAHFGETDATVGLKTQAAIRHRLVPLICIGETKSEKTAGCADRVLQRQVEAAFAALNDAQKSAPILLAYEPVWAIGEAGTPASPDYADARQAHIIAVARRITGRHVPCLYGGSVDAGNCADFILRPHVDGLFIGRAAWEIEGYLDILARCATAVGQKAGSVDGRG